MSSEVEGFSLLREKGTNSAGTERKRTLLSLMQSQPLSLPPAFCSHCWLLFLSGLSSNTVVHKDRPSPGADHMLFVSLSDSQK